MASVCKATAHRVAVANRVPTTVPALNLHRVAGLLCCREPGASCQSLASSCHGTSGCLKQHSLLQTISHGPCDWPLQRPQVVHMARLAEGLVPLPRIHGDYPKLPLPVSRTICRNSPSNLLSNTSITVDLSCVNQTGSQQLRPGVWLSVCSARRVASPFGQSAG